VLARGRVSRTGTFTISSSPGHGDYTFTVGIAATSGNLAGSSTPFVVRRR
jgi:hypothetical protein